MCSRGERMCTYGGGRGMLTQPSHCPKPGSARRRNSATHQQATRLLAVAHKQHEALADAGVQLARLLQHARGALQWGRVVEW